MNNVWTKYGRYPGNYPQQPYKPHEPQRKNYIGEGAKKGKCIYSDFELLNDSIDDLSEFWENHGYDEGEEPKHEDIGLRDNLTLQDLLDKMPPGAEPKDIVFDLSYPRYVDYIWISFNHIKRNLETEEASYKRDMENYQKELAVYQVELAKYQKDLADYQAWEKEQQVKELEKQIADLKK